MAEMKKNFNSDKRDIFQKVKCPNNILAAISKHKLKYKRYERSESASKKCRPSFSIHTCCKGGVSRSENSATFSKRSGLVMTLKQ